MTEKTIGGWLIVDWRDEQHRTRKGKPKSSELGSNELLAELEVNVTVPEIEVPKLAVDIDVPEPQVRAAALDALDEEDMPDWTDTAAEIVADYKDEVNTTSDLPRLVDAVTGRVMREVNTRPDPDKVHKYVYKLFGEYRKSGEERANA